MSYHPSRSPDRHHPLDTGAWQAGGAPFHVPVAAADPHPRDGLPAWKWWALLVANCSLSIMHGYDVSNVANIQASIYRAFGHMELLHWVALSYSVCNIAFIPLGRKLFKFADFKTLNLVSMLFIIAGSALAGAAPNIQSIIAGRGLMALGTSVIYQGILSFNIIFAYPHELGLVQGVIGACFAVGLILGPIIGGAFAASEHATWRWAFYLVIPLCAVSFVLQALFSPRYRVPGGPKSTWAHVREIDWLGGALHAGVCVLFAVGCGALGSAGAGAGGGGEAVTAAAVWAFFGLAAAAYAVQQASGASAERRLLAPCARLRDRAVLTTWVCTAAAAASYGVALYYTPIYFAFTRGCGPLAAAARLLPFVGAFVGAVVLAGALLPAARVYQPFFALGAALLLAGAAALQTLRPDSPEPALMAFEALVAAGVGLNWQLGVAVCTARLPRDGGADKGAEIEARLDLALLSNLAQLGGIAAALAVAGMVYDSVGARSLRQAARAGVALSAADIRELLAGVDSPLLAADGDPAVLRAAVAAVTDAVRACFAILLGAGALCFVAACAMEWEALDFKPKPQLAAAGAGGGSGSTRCAPGYAADGTRDGRSTDDDDFLLRELPARPGTGSDASAVTVGGEPSILQDLPPAHHDRV
ncbi:MFS general substrate transporter [Durotheca rogersii]|uniref:MFS general substrate transporter n=1 Tax=Durotheca rogersii TaxID=419775 RepID=UPI002220A450|nr:MFS general substrate transporter [Durotheca rogersii]KAI5861210.1 MFS general substrate transporter [Durotheca rogersii]